MDLFDTVVLDGVRRTRDGYLVADAKVGRTGIQTYRGAELGRPDLATVRVYRPESAVFAQDAMASAAWRPVTVDHPSEMVTADNWKEHAVGLTGDQIARDGAFIRVPLTLMDAKAIQSVEGGKRELSLGYTCDLEFKDGVTPEGEAYDAIQSAIRINHLAICSAARGGPDLRIGDQEHRDKGGPTVALKTIIVDGLPVETTDAGEAAVNKLRGMLDAAGKAMETATAAHVAAIATKDAELGAKDARIAELEKQVVTGAALDALVAERSTVIAKVRALAPTLDASGKSNADLKRAAVAAKLGDEKVKDKSDDYVGALFDHLAADVKTPDPLREVIGDGPLPIQDAKAKAEQAYAKRRQDLQSAWEKSAA
jgi:hypothetical protein